MAPKKPKPTLDAFYEEMKAITAKYGRGPSAESRMMELVESKFGDILDQDEVYDVVDGRKRLVGDYSDPKIERVEQPNSREITSQNGWLSPEGRFYPCKYHQHSWLASMIWRDAKSCHDERSLEEAGWVKVQNAGDYQTFFHYSMYEERCTRQPTEIQRRMALEYCLINKHDPPYWAEER